jgi:glycosyltransferase involved in cell wall biosynthesis
MRLLLLTPYFAPAYAFGGSVTVAETIVEDVLAAGHEVAVATTDVLDGERRIELDAPPQPVGAEVVRFPNLSHRLAAGLNGYAPRGLRRWLGGNIDRFDVVLLHDVYSAVSVMGARAAARAGVPFALQPLGTLSPARERGRPVIKRAFLALWGKRTVRSASALLYLAEHEADDFLSAGGSPERLVAMPLPLDLPAAAESHELSQPTIAFVGRLHPIKGIDVLIEAVALVRPDVPNVRLEIVGPGDRCRRNLEQLAARLGLGDAVRFRGFVEVSEKTTVLAEAHVSALLSRSEGLPMAALEAMACGTPVVLSHGCHLDEVDGKAGLAVPGTAQDAAAAILRLLSDDAMRSRFSTGALEFAHRFRREVVMPQMIAALEQIAAKPPQRAPA